MNNWMPLNKQPTIFLGEASLRVHSAIHYKIVLRSGCNGIIDINIACEVTVPDVSNCRRGICLVKIQIHRGLRSTVSQHCAFICAVELMEGEVVTVDIELTAAVTPLHIVGIHLLSITQYHRWPAADNADIFKGLNVAIAVRSLRQDDRPLTDIQSTWIKARTVHFQCSGSKLMQVIALNTVHLPVNGTIAINNDPAAFPGLRIEGLNTIIIIKRQRSRSLINGVF